MKNIFALTLLFSASCSTNSSSDSKKTESQQSNETVQQLQFPPLERGALKKNVFNQFDSTQSYCFYLPAGDTLSGSAILFFDPKGDGCIPVKKYQSLAEQYRVILAGSNDSQNGLQPEQSAAIAANFVNDVTARLKLNREKIIVCGFSGGARVAVQTAIRENLRAAIGCGAGFPGEPNRKFGFDYIGMVGNEDFNYLEMRRLDRRLKELGMNHQLIVFDGEHEWVTVERLEIAFLCLNELKNHTKISDNEKIGELSMKNYAYFLPPQDETEMEEREAAQQAEMAQAFSTGDFNGLETKVKFLSSASKEKSAEQKQSDKRLLNFISLMGFLYSENALNVDSAKAKKYLDIYGKADFDNSDYHYLMACYYAKTGNVKASVSSMEKSVEYGFTDFEKALHDASLESLKSDLSFKNLMDSLITTQ